MHEKKLEYPPIPTDDLKRTLKLAAPDKEDGKLPHIGLVGDTYTITVSGDDTNDRFCVIDMYVPPGGGPGPHRHDFEETFILLEGEVEVTFRGRKSIVKAGDTINIPSTLRTNFITVLQAQRGYSASVRRQARKTSSWNLARRLQQGQQRRRNSALTSRQPS